MLELLLLQLINNIVIPEIADFMKKKHDATGQWPTKEELQAEAMKLHDQIKTEGLAFLNRPKV